MELINDRLLSSNAEEDMAMVKKATGMLRERFDSVQVFCTRLSADDGGTINVHNGNGDWFARYGLCRAWIIQEENGFKHEGINPT